MKPISQPEEIKYLNKKISKINKRNFLNNLKNIIKK